VVHDLTLYPPTVNVDGIVASALSGTPISGASVTLTGMTTENIAWTAVATTGADGRFVATAYPGTYQVRASDSGFTESSVPVQLLNGSSSVPVTVDLSPISSTSSPASSSGPLIYVVAGIAVAAVLTAGLILWMRRPPSSRTPSSPPSRPTWKP
jgi:Carboxypeptidase regulatory-like domain